MKVINSSVTTSVGASILRSAHNHPDGLSIIDLRVEASIDLFGRTGKIPSDKAFSDVVDRLVVAGLLDEVGLRIFKITPRGKEALETVSS